MAFVVYLKARGGEYEKADAAHSRAVTERDAIIVHRSEDGEVNLVWPAPKKAPGSEQGESQDLEATA